MVFLYFPDLGTPYIQGRENAIQANWNDLNQYNAVQAAQQANLYNALTFDNRLTQSDYDTQIRGSQANTAYYDDLLNAATLNDRVAQSRYNTQLQQAAANTAYYDNLLNTTMFGDRVAQSRYNTQLQQAAANTAAYNDALNRAALPGQQALTGALSNQRIQYADPLAAAQVQGLLNQYEYSAGTYGAQAEALRRAAIENAAGQAQTAAASGLPPSQAPIPVPTSTPSVSTAQAAPSTPVPVQSQAPVASFATVGAQSYDAAAAQAQARRDALLAQYGIPQPTNPMTYVDPNAVADSGLWATFTGQRYVYPPNTTPAPAPEAYDNLVPYTFRPSAGAYPGGAGTPIFNDPSVATRIAGTALREDLSNVVVDETYLNYLGATPEVLTSIPPGNRVQLNNNVQVYRDTDGRLWAIPINPADASARGRLRIPDTEANAFRQAQ